MNRPPLATSTLAVAVLGGALGLAGCSAPPSSDNGIPVGLMLSYTGYLASNSINSERALLMAFEAANAGGGAEGRPLNLIPRDTRSDVTKIRDQAQELVDAGAVIFIGPDTIDLATTLRMLLQNRTMILPSYATSSDIGFGSKPNSWFVMGAATGRMACELYGQLKADGRKNPLVIENANGYNSAIGFSMAGLYGIPKYVLPADDAATMSAITPLMAAQADAYVLAAFPPSGSALTFALAAIGALQDPGRWYLSPTLHNPVFLDSLPKGALDGAHGVSPGTVAGAGDFRDAFEARWQDEPLDDAYPFYDAGAVAALAIERALVRTGSVPDGTGMSEHLLAVTKADEGSMVIEWNELGRGLALLHEGKEVEYVGISGSTQFDATGQAPGSNTKWWTIRDDAFTDVADNGDCR